MDLPTLFLPSPNGLRKRRIYISYAQLTTAGDTYSLPALFASEETHSQNSMAPAQPDRANCAICNADVSPAVDPFSLPSSPTSIFPIQRQHLYLCFPGSSREAISPSPHHQRRRDFFFFSFSSSSPPPPVATSPPSASALLLFPCVPSPRFARLDAKINKQTPKTDNSGPAALGQARIRHKALRYLFRFSSDLQLPC